MNNNELQEQLDALKLELDDLKGRLYENEMVIAMLQTWTQYSFGILLRHLSDPDKVGRSQVSNQIEMALIRNYRRLKQGFRGGEPLQTSSDGFDRLYICAEDTASIWQSMDDHNFAEKSDQDGYKLINAAMDILDRIDPQSQRIFPFETKQEKEHRIASLKAINQARQKKT